MKNDTDRAATPRGEADVRALAKIARNVAAAPDYDEQAIRDALWAVVDAVLAPTYPEPINFYGQPITRPEYFDGAHVANPGPAGAPPVCSCGWTRWEYAPGQWFEMSDHLRDMRPE